MRKCSQCHEIWLSDYLNSFSDFLTSMGFSFTNLLHFQRALRSFDIGEKVIKSHIMSWNFDLLKVYEPCIMQLSKNYSNHVILPEIMRSVQPFSERDVKLILVLDHACYLYLIVARCLVHLTLLIITYPKAWQSRRYLIEISQYKRPCKMVTMCGLSRDLQVQNAVEVCCLCAASLNYREIVWMIIGNIFIKQIIANNFVSILIWTSSSHAYAVFCLRPKVNV